MYHLYFQKGIPNKNTSNFDNIIRFVTGKLPAEKRLVNVKEFERFIIRGLASMALNENEIFGDGRKTTTSNF